MDPNDNPVEPWINNAAWDKIGKQAADEMRRLLDIAEANRRKHNEQVTDMLAVREKVMEEFRRHFKNATPRECVAFIFNAASPYTLYDPKYNYLFTSDDMKELSDFCRDIAYAEHL